MDAVTSSNDGCREHTAMSEERNFPGFRFCLADISADRYVFLITYLITRSVEEQMFATSNG